MTRGDSDKDLRQHRRREILDVGCTWLLLYIVFLIATLIAVFIATRWVL